MPYIEIKNIDKKYNKKVIACNNISLKIEKGEIIALIGESGCGKSTFLKILSGFEFPDKGELKINNHFAFNSNTYKKAEERNISILFQEHSLFPHLTIKQNLELAIKNKDRNYYNDLIKISSVEDLLERYPHEISGGQQQRVALIRTLLLNPDLILLDEPFSSLDEFTKSNLRTYFKRTLKENNLTTILVTHDITDAAEFADRILVMQEGNIISDSNYEELYQNPKNEYIGSLLKNINILPAKLFDLQYQKNMGLKPSSIDLTEGKYQGTVLNCIPLFNSYKILIEYKNNQLFTFSEKFIPSNDLINFSIKLDEIIHFE